MKKCKTCGKEKMITDFPPRSRECKECFYKWKRDNYRKKRDQYIVAIRKYTELHKEEKRKYDSVYQNGISYRELGEKCSECGSDKRLVIHHKDGNGRNKPRKERNNNRNNLVVLCQSCHAKLHAKIRCQSPQ